MNATANKTTIAAILAAAALAVVGISATFGGSNQTQTPDVRVPDWFPPIAEHYDRNPAITPSTDFAELHFGALTPPVFRRDGSKAKPGLSDLSTERGTGRHSR
jgi:hypothetical protein